VPLWTLYGLKQGKASTRWPASGDSGQAGTLGMPRFDPAKCQDGCRRCAEVCLPGAITVTDSTHEARVAVDYGRCVTCQMCVEACPTGAFSGSDDWAFGVRSREDLIWATPRPHATAGAQRRDSSRLRPQSACAPCRCRFLQRLRV